MSKKRWHIAHFTNTYHPVISGVVRSVSTFRQALTDLGHNVFIFAQQSSDYEDDEPFIFRYPAFSLPMFDDFPLTIPVSRFMDRLLPSLKLDVIHSHHPFLLGQTAARQAESLAVPLVFTFHTRYREYSHYVSLNQELVKATLTRWLGDYIQKCHHVVVPSDSIRDILAETYGVTRQVSVVPTGIEVETFRQADGDPIRQEQGWGRDTVLISVGRLAEEKNWHTLLQAVRPVLTERDDVRLVLIGEGEARPSLEAYTQEAGIADRVEFTGALPFETVPQYLQAADIFCFASVTETQGLATMEAMAAGLPVVAVDATGTADVVDDGEQGFLTENDSEALARAIAEVVADADLRQQFRQAAIEKADLFEAVRLAEKLVSIYEQAIQDHRAGRFVPVDQEEIGAVDEEWWSKLLGLRSSV